ncbi:MAG: VWA domain-containing protein, partial [Spirochaetales bacterium]|nr:VWA domain-containing protein [Spirochaetales bacterium]
FILEDGNNPTDFRDISDTDRPADVVLVMDITGTLQDSYSKMRTTIENAMQNVAAARNPLRVGLITFADTPDESIFRDLTSDYHYIIDSLIKATPQSGGDYEENPYDALMRVRDFSFRDEAQKIVILVTDAPPHVKGDKGNKGRDFTNYSTEDVDKFFAGSPYMLYVVTYARFADYHKLIRDDADLFDVSSFESPTVIIRDLTNVINSQIKMAYIAKRSKSFYTRTSNSVRDKIIVYKDLDAHKAKNFYNQKKIKKNSFMNSLFDGF